jgi:RNA polymerase sigma factor (sigma-70 family)
LTDALISGEAGVALLIDGAGLRSFSLGNTGEPVSRRPEEVHFLFGDARDLQVLENVTEDTVAARLKSAATRIDCLQLILILLDPTLADDTHLEAASEIEELLTQAGMARTVEGILYAHPLPASADPVRAIAACGGAAARTALLVSQLVSRQAKIAEVHQAWQQIPHSVFGTPEDREHAQAVFVREGLFRKLVVMRERELPPSEMLWRFQAITRKIENVPRHRIILTTWVDAFQQGSPKRRASDQSVDRTDIDHGDKVSFFLRKVYHGKKKTSTETHGAILDSSMGEFRPVRGHMGGLNEVGDREVVSLFLMGDAEAAVTVDSCIAWAAWPYQRRLSNRWEDVLQDVRLEVTRLLGQGKFRGSSLRAYLWRVVSHACLDQLRAESRWKWADLEAVDELAATAPPLEAVIHERDLVKKVLEQVPGDCRELWRLVVMGLSYREMSQRLGVAEGTLRVRLLRCREKAVALRRELLEDARGDAKR